MAQLTRSQIQTLIDAYTAKTLLYITTNGNKEITGAQLKEILDDNGILLEDIKDSYYSLLDDLADSVNYTPLISADWDLPIPTEVKAGLDQLAQRLKGFEPLSQNFAVLDSTNGSDTEGKVGNWNRPFKTGLAIVSALPTNSTIFVINGATTLSISGKNIAVVGFGNTINSITVGTSGTIVRIYNLTITSGTSVQISNGSKCFLYNTTCTNLTNSTGGGNYILENCTVNGTAVFVQKANSSTFASTVSTTNLEVVDITNNVFKGAVTLIDRTGGKLYKNSFETTTNIPILWQKGLNASQLGGRIDIYGNNFTGTATYVIEETGALTASMKARVYANYYEQANLANVTVNEVLPLLNPNNIKFN